MRIGLFTDSYPPYINGVSTSVENLRNMLIKMGHTVYVITVNDSIIKMEYDENEKILKIPAIPTKIYDYRLSKICSKTAMRRVRKWNLDIIHSHTEFGVGIFARIFAKKYKIPLVHTYHTLYEDYVHYISHNHFNKLKKKLVKILTRIYCVKTAAKTIVPTEKIYKLFRDKYLIKDNVCVIPSGIDLEKFHEENIKQKEVKKVKELYNIKSRKDFIIIYVGRLAQEKNIEFLLKAHKKLSKKDNIKLLIVGDGPDREKYIKDAEKLGISEAVIFAGKVPQNEIQYCYNCADIFVTASKSETQGLTLIEAMAAGVIPLCINDQVFNKILPESNLFNNEDEYINKIMQFTENRKLIKKEKSEFRKLSENYSSKKYAERVLKLYREVIKEVKGKANKKE